MTDEILDEGPVEGVDVAEMEVPEEAPEDAPEAEAPAEEDRSGWGEIEIDGEVYLTPPALRSAFLRQADYTRKTQELAEQRRRMEAEREAAGAHVAARARLHLLDEQARALEGLDWPALEAADPERARALPSGGAPWPRPGNGRPLTWPGASTRPGWPRRRRRPRR